MRKLGGFFIVFFCFSVQSNAAVDWNTLLRIMAGQPVSLGKTWTVSNSWTRRFFPCYGWSRYNTSFGATLSRIRHIRQVTPSRYYVIADFRNVWIRTEGRRRSSTCVYLRGWTGADTDSATVSGYVSFPQSSNGRVQIQIISSDLGHVNLGRYAPRFLERFGTGFLNRTLKYVWAHRFGDWLNARLTHALNQRSRSR